MLNKVSYCKKHLQPGTQGKNKHNDPIFLSQIFNVCFMAVTCHLVGTKTIFQHWNATYSSSTDATAFSGQFKMLRLV